MKQNLSVMILRLSVAGIFVFLMSVGKTCMGQNPPVYISFDPPATTSPSRKPVAVRPVAKTGKMQFAFTRQSEQQTATCGPVKKHPSQVAAQRRKLNKERSTAVQNAPGRIPLVQTGRTYPELQPAPADPTRLNSIATALASGQYDGYIIVSDEEYTQLKRGETSRIDPARVRTLTARPSQSPLAQYDNMFNRMEFSLAKLPRNPNAITLPPPPASSVWARFLTGKQSEEIKNWKGNYIELARNRMSPSSDRGKGLDLVPDSMLARRELPKPVEMLPLETPYKTPQERIQLVSGELPQELIPKRHEAKPLRMESDEPSTTLENGKMKVYRPRD